MLHPHDVTRILIFGRATFVARMDGFTTMYRVIAIVGGGLALAACSSSSEWLKLDAFKSGPTMETVRFESEPPGAEAKTSSGQTCRTPCALAIPQPESGGVSVAFTLTGYQPAAEQIELVSQGDNTSKLRPNPVVVQLTPAVPPKAAKSRKRTSAKPATAKPKPAAAKPKAAAAKPKPAPKPMAAPPPMTPVQQPPAPSPWPAPAQPAR